MAYDPNPNRGPVRDKAYPSEIAAERPALVTRIQCVENAEEISADNTLMGSASDNRVAKMNRQLREG